MKNHTTIGPASERLALLENDMEPRRKDAGSMNGETAHAFIGSASKAAGPEITSIFRFFVLIRQRFLHLGQNRGNLCNTVSI